VAIRLVEDEEEEEEREEEGREGEDKGRPRATARRRMEPAVRRALGDKLEGKEGSASCCRRDRARASTLLSSSPSLPPSLPPKT
jgi:hypothetical protein